MTQRCLMLLLMAVVPAQAGRATLHVPRITRSIHIDAEMAGKKEWEAEAGSTGNFKNADGRGLVPYTDAKVRWGQGRLYLRLYAGDLDIQGRVKKRDRDLRGDDFFHLEIGGPRHLHVIDISVLGVVADRRCPLGVDHEATGEARCDRRWHSHAEVAVDVDGTLNRIHDNDEEWLVEVALPLAALELGGAAAGTHIPFSVSRCEAGYDGAHACGGWGDGGPGGELILDP